MAIYRHPASFVSSADDQVSKTHPCEGVGPFGVCPADRGAPRTLGAVNLHVSARSFRTQYAQGSAPSHLTFRFLQRSHAATTRSTRRRFSEGSE